MDRPWYVTGANEMVGVLSAYYQAGTGGNAGIPSGVDVDEVSLLALDPINVTAGSHGYSQTQLSFVSPTPVPPSGGHTTQNYDLAGGNPVRVPSPLDPAAEKLNIWGYEPQYDATSGHWYADIQLAMDGYADSPPPGYFLRLSIARFQPYSIGATNYVDATDNRYLSSPTLVTIAQPVVDRTVAVVSGVGGTFDVTVTGPGYYGWRPAPENPTEAWVHDVYNEYALHPHSDHKGAQASSTMVVELQKYDDTSGFSGDFGWSTVQDGVFTLEATFDDSPMVTWKSKSNSPVQLPPFVNESTFRLRISELDYYQFDGGDPTVIDSTYRRTFVALIPL
jgi:hypothetical protein